METTQYKPKNRIRFVTAASLFDGHDAAINIMRRILQRTGTEVIHLGHNRSAREIVQAALEEDAGGIAISSYQGGHVLYFKYIVDMLREEGAEDILVFGGGGGVIVPDEIEELQNYGVRRIYSPADGRTLGLQGIINDMVRSVDELRVKSEELRVKNSSLTPDPSSGGRGGIHPLALARVLTRVEQLAEEGKSREEILESGTGILPVNTRETRVPPPVVLGITGTGGAGKSSLTDELLRRLQDDFPNLRIAIIAVDPSSRKHGGALLGDRIRMNFIESDNIYMRSFATRGSSSELSAAVPASIDVLKSAGYELIIVETSGIGQAQGAVSDIADLSLYVMTSEFGAATQLEKIEMLDFADVIAINKFERRGSEDALRDVRKQFRRNRNLFDQSVIDDELPVFGTIASQFGDRGVNCLYTRLLALIGEKSGREFASEHYNQPGFVKPDVRMIVPPDRTRALAEIAKACRDYRAETDEQIEIASDIYGLTITLNLIEKEEGCPPCRLALYPAEKLEIADEGIAKLRRLWNEKIESLDPELRKTITGLPEFVQAYKAQKNSYEVRGKKIEALNYSKSLSGSDIPKIAIPDTWDFGELVRYFRLENVPGEFPYTQGVFPYKRQQEDPTRMFAGEGPPLRTNRRFHYVSEGLPAARLSTAFDSVTLYGADPDPRPDIFGKVGESGVSVCTLDDMEKLYSGFDLCDPLTSVSMTINGPAPIILAMYFNAAVRQQVRKFLREEGRLKIAVGQEFYPELLWPTLDKIHARAKGWHGHPARGDHGRDDRATVHATGVPKTFEETRALLNEGEYERIEAKTLAVVRGTVQADILKEDQAQNTCIFSTEFALKMMGDVQEFFIENNVRNYYSVSISGYHIAEAGANPISQLAFTLANGFTYIEYYLRRGMSIDDFAPNLSFFFSNGLDPEYTVIGRVARRIFAVAMKYLYEGSERSQKLKYHIQTSGRSLHAQEIDFNDIRTTLQALIALADNAQSLHTNAYDEAITTPTEDSVRRALAIQMITSREFGMMLSENAFQGSYFLTYLTDIVEKSVLEEFDRLADRGGVLGAMETQYQRSKIQEESLYYEQRKESGELPIIGVNTFIDPKKDGKMDCAPELIRASTEEKQGQIDNLSAFKKRHANESGKAKAALKKVALSGENIFAELMETVQSCSLGEISDVLYFAGGKYRRSM
ncbi:MAG: methylmalonyl-CoA mutase family protein [Planctomycetes bacterium]|nr:methylmalonyl-CoA mutase family protein [Planctomycetota bacterium]